MKPHTTQRRLLGAAALLAIPLLVLAQPTGDGQPAGRLLQRISTGQLRHGSRNLCLAYSPNGQLLVGGGGSDPVRVWDGTTGQQKFTCPETWVNAIVFTTRGSVFITGGMFKTIRLWETATGKEAGQLAGHNAPVKALALAPDGSMLASAGQDGTVILWELTTKKKIIELKQHTDEVTSIAFCPANEVPVLVTGGNDRTVCVWDSDTNQLTKKINAGCDVLAVAVSKDGKTAFSAGDDNLLRVWEAATGKLLHTLQGPDGMLVSLAVTRDGTTLISGGRDKSIRLWDIANLTAKPRIIERHLGDSDALAVARDGKHIATAGLNNTIRIFETATGKELFAGDNPQAGLTGLTLSRDGKTLAAVTAPGIVYLWDAQTGQQLRHFATGHVGDISLAFTPDGKSLVTAAETVRFWDPQAGTQRFELPWAAKERSPVLGLAFSPDGKTMAIGTRDKHVLVYEVDSKRCTDTFTYPGQPYALAFSTDNGLLAVSGSSKIVLWDCAGHKELRQFECKEAAPMTVLPDVAALAFSPDRKTIAAACFDGPIRVIDFTTAKEAGVCEG